MNEFLKMPDPDVQSNCTCGERGRSDFRHVRSCPINPFYEEAEVPKRAMRKFLVMINYRVTRGAKWQDLHRDLKVRNWAEAAAAAELMEADSSPSHQTKVTSILRG